MSSQGPLNVLVFGKTGSGKSTIINHLTNDNPHLPEGESLDSCTKDIQTASIVHKGREMTFFDTPGFDDSIRTPHEYLKKLIEDLGFLYDLKFEKKPHIHGVLWMHPIHERKMTGSDRLNLDIFKDILGSDGFSNLVFVTNFWSPSLPAHQLRNEKNLIGGGEYFAEAIAAGARAGPSYRIFEGTDRLSVQRALLDAFVDSKPKVMQAQSEFVNGGGTADKTTAAKTLIKKTNEQLAERDAKIAALEAAVNEKTRKDMETLKTSYADALERLRDRVPSWLGPVLGGVMSVLTGLAKR
ncbi:unnamed protein product [Rhizoctonia solani]|uniref:G domain-containing protein n=1 Tax=Rhizoctonia solani TaxID=456999 RepID=A0A8H3E3H7_9AGAM|nr:unnamed protein product [Rhizoctonia solani]